jgi:hypothetical protein
MENLHRLKTEILIDMLSIQTDAFLRMHAVGAKEDEFARCQLLLRALQKELGLRKRNDFNINTSNEEVLAE